MQLIIDVLATTIYIYIFVFFFLCSQKFDLSATISVHAMPHVFLLAKSDDKRKQRMKPHVAFNMSQNSDKNLIFDNHLIPYGKCQFSL